ncbi:hypothetical protein [Brevibacterium sp. FME17]|uniref:hypothetical protein n=1 Tax=Brevibacterium sp. FME17 TaxID=2742606 RepID=UPI001868C6E9|nr:hypothetical protein [Brevibacterium sp. FME17]
MAKTKTAIRQEARERAQKRQEAELAKRQRLIDGATAVFETAAQIDLIDEKQDEAIAKAREKLEKEISGIRAKFDEERALLAEEKADGVRSMLSIEGATVKDIAEAVELTQAEVKSIKAAMPAQKESLEFPKPGSSVAADDEVDSVGAGSQVA